MKYISLFDIVGPIMVGPSSSHTAGAVRLGFLARKIFGEKPETVIFNLYNSFAKTGKGHGTDKGLLGGVLGFEVSDTRIKDAEEFAKKENIKYVINYIEDPNRYPNSVDIEFCGASNMRISGDSIGAGHIKINEVNGFKVELRGDYPTLLLIYKDKPGMISKVSNIIQSAEINIAGLSCERNSKGKEATMSISLDSILPDELVKTLNELTDIYVVRNIEKLKQ